MNEIKKLNFPYPITDEHSVEPLDVLYEHYEKTKLEKFIGSSKLECIEIEIPSKENTLINVLAKYKKPPLE